MHGREGEERKRRQLRHMLQVPSGPGAVTAAATVNSKQNSGDFFVKDGRKIQIGDCALFQAGNAPPFIGLIRWLKFNTGSGEHLKLGVNWLYRPADIKLSKGTQLEAAPNEIFYSFHRDEIPAASLLHPCKVAFLRKGVELPTGISSFVCRRVYDIANKCLWWLTDQDYINERQEEVDQLLDKTQFEMHAPQSGGRSPKPSNGSSSAQQLKSVSEGAQNSGTSFPQQVKIKKRERSETEPIKRERSLKVEDGDSVSSKLDSVIKSEIAKITEKGGLMSIEAVEKLVHLMQLDRSERKLDLGGRVLLADVISATDRYDCLTRFVHLRGVSVLDEWLQEAHRGKTGDGSSPKESDRPVEELLLALLRALDKLPVNLNALQTCNVGKSVNQLRSHKNVEIQKKARSLVETWKKRVDAEMTKLNDAKSATTWPVKQGFAEVSHGGNRRTGPAELVMKSSITQPSTCKTLSGKPGHTDSTTKMTAVIPGPLKTSAPLPSPVSSTLKDTVAKTSGGVSEVPITTVKEEKSSGSNQSQNNSQSCSGDPMKATGSSWKEDARNLTAGSVISCKSSSSGVSRHRRASNGFVGTTASGTQKDTTLGKSGPLNRTATLDKVAQSGLACERQSDVPVADLGNSSHRLIVRLPNPGRSPARSASGGSFEDPSMTGSRSSSPGVPDKTDHIDRRTKIKGEACRSNIIMDGHTDLWQNNDTKEGLVASDEGMKSQAGNVEEETCRNAEDVGKCADLSRTSSSSLGNDKDIVPHDAAKLRNSFSSMNALIESCANEATVLSAGDDIGINLLASVAAGEMSKSLASPSGSPGSPPVMEDNETKPRLPSDGLVAQSHFQPPENAGVDSGKHDKGAGPVANKDELRPSAFVSVDDKTVIPLLESKLADVKGVLISEGAHQPGEDHKSVGITSDSFTDCKTKVKSIVSEENRSLDCLAEKIAEEGKSDFACVTAGDGCDVKDAASTMKIEKAVGDSGCPHSKIEVQKQELVEEGAVSVALTEQHPAPLVVNNSDAVDRSEHISDSSSVVQFVNPPGVDDSKAEKSSSSRSRTSLEPADVERKDQTHLPPSAADVHLPSTLAIKGPEVSLDRKEPSHHCTAEFGKSEASSIIHGHETELTKSSGSKVSGPDVDHTEEPASSTDASLAASVGPDCTSKIDFDLNEGFLGDDGHQSEPVSVPQPVCSPAIHLPNLPHFASPPLPHGSPAPITVAAPAKGPFVPPENLLKSKAGWKGSAATSAFRPAEPRKVLEMPLSTSDVPSSDANAGKQSRPALDIDLNVPDERVLEDMASQSSAHTTGSESGVVNNRDGPVRVAGGLDLDLNRVDESSEIGILTNTNRRTEFPLLPVRAAQTSLPNADANNLRDFDLNGPGIDEAGTESGMRNNQAKGSNLTLLPSIAGLRMNNSELGNVSTWFPPSNSYPAVAIPSFLHDRGEHHPYPIVAAAGAQRIPGPATGTTFGADIYRHQVLTSSPAMAFSHTPSFQYAGFPFGSSFPVASNSFAGAPPTYGDSSAGAGPFFPTIPSQIMGPAGAVSSHYHQRPYVISLPESSTTGGSDSNRKWARPGLDLNAGPGSADAEARDERLSSAPRQLNIASTQAFVEEQARMFQMPGGGLKRKEPEGGWDAERFAYKQSSWH